MATISAYDSSSIGVLFSGLTTGKTSGTFGSSDLLGINYSDYATIRNGSYFKLLNAYYKDGKSINGVTDSVSTSTAKDDTKTLARIESAADDMKTSASELQQTGSKSVFEQVTKKDQNGNSKVEYDTDRIYKSVKSFVDDYNDLIDAAADSDTTGILRSANTMINDSKANQKLLASIGVTIGSDHKLSVDEKKFKSADMTTVKSLFQDRGSYGYQIMTQASMIESLAKSEAVKANTYGNSGTYTYNYTTGELYNSVV